MRLVDALEGCEYDLAEGAGPGLRDIEIRGVAYDSRKVSGGTLFVAIKGDNFDGHDFIGDAMKRGAVAIVSERDTWDGKDRTGAALIKVEDGRRALACVSNNFFERPSEHIPVIGVTGTNGKTTVTYLMKSILEAWGRNVGLIGTIRYLVRDVSYPAVHTTPESPEFQGLLRRMISEGCDFVVTEVSSHSLSRKRVDYTRFNRAVFTNLTRDHLDFHGTMEHYYEAKKRLFAELLSEGEKAVINADDPWGRRLLEEMPGEAITYGLESDADVTAGDIEFSFSGVSFSLRQRDGAGVRIFSPLVGTFNIYNALAAAATAVSLGVPLNAIAEGIRNTRSVEGRIERVDEGQDFLCLVDYAHTPDALERLILTARELVNRGRASSIASEAGEGRTAPRIITVFGCGGNRDRGKRPVMGEIAARLSDVVFITSDNPRREDPIEIMREVESGIQGDNHLAVPDRREAIILAIEKAGTGDIVVIAGKGHEDYQEIGDVRYRFSDREVAGEAIRNKLGKYAVGAAQRKDV